MKPRPTILLKDSPCWPPEGIPGLTGDEVCLVLTKGFVSLVDAEDAAELQQYFWRAQLFPHQAYAVRGCRGGSRVFLHREITKPSKDMDVDHIDQHHLFGFKIVNNRRSNLRAITRSQNLANSRKRPGCSSTYKGVSWRADRKKWQAQTYCSRQHKYLGLFDSEIDAANAYDAAHALNHPSIPEGTNAHMMKHSPR
jgi:hypothetical protein